MNSSQKIVATQDDMHWERIAVTFSDGNEINLPRSELAKRFMMLSATFEKFHNDKSEGIKFHVDLDLSSFLVLYDLGGPEYTERYNHAMEKYRRMDEESVAKLKEVAGYLIFQKDAFIVPDFLLETSKLVRERDRIESAMECLGELDGIFDLEAVKKAQQTELKPSISFDDWQKLLIRIVNKITVFKMATGKEPVDINKFEKFPLIQAFLKTIRYYAWDSNDDKFRSFLFDDDRLEYKVPIERFLCADGDVATSQGTPLAVLLAQGLIHCKGFKLMDSKRFPWTEWARPKVGEQMKMDFPVKDDVPTIYGCRFFLKGDKEKYRKDDAQAQSAIRNNISRTVKALLKMLRPGFLTSDAKVEYPSPDPFSPESKKKLHQLAEEYLDMDCLPINFPKIKEFSELVFNCAGLPPSDLPGFGKDESLVQVKREGDDFNIKFPYNLKNRVIELVVSMNNGFISAENKSEVEPFTYKAKELTAKDIWRMVYDPFVPHFFGVGTNSVELLGGSELKLPEIPIADPTSNPEVEYFRPAPFSMESRTELHQLAKAYFEFQKVLNLPKNFNKIKEFSKLVCSCAGLPPIDKHGFEAEGVFVKEAAEDFIIEFPYSLRGRVIKLVVSINDGLKSAVNTSEWGGKVGQHQTLTAENIWGMAYDPSVHPFFGIGSNSRELFGHPPSKDLSKKMMKRGMLTSKIEIGDQVSFKHADTTYSGVVVGRNEVEFTVKAEGYDWKQRARFLSKIG